MSDINIGIIVGSTRPGRNGMQVGQWVKDNAKADGVEFELVDLHDFKLPMLEEPFPAGAGNYLGDAANAWAAARSSAGATSSSHSPIARASSPLMRRPV